MSQYIFQRTDPTATAIIVQPYTVNGPLTPESTTLYTNTLSGLSAVTESTSLVLAGKGVPEYGELVQNNLIYLLEHFSGKTRPRNPLQGQIWYKNANFTDVAYGSDPVITGLYMWNGTAWVSIVLNSAVSGGDLDLAGSKIINLGVATAAGDALSLGVGDARYLRLAGGAVAGSVSVGGILSVAGATTLSNTLNVTGVSTFSDDVTFASGSTVVITDTPTLALHAANKSYVDSAVSAATGGPAAFLALTGGTVAGPLTITDSVSVGVTSTLNLTANVSLILQPGSGTVNFGNRAVGGVGTPLSNSDAATKKYVDDSVALGGGGTSKYVTAGSLSSGGQLTLTQSDATVVTVSGSFASLYHTHTDYDLTYNTPQASQTLLAPTLAGAPLFPQVSFTSVIRELDKAAHLSRAPYQRRVITAPGATTTFTLPTPRMQYVVGENRLSVYVDGVKKVASEYGSSRITFTGTNINPQSASGLAVGTYNTTFTIDGGSSFVIPVPVAIVPFTYTSIVASLNKSFSGNPTAGTPASGGRLDYSWTGLASSASTGLANNATTYTATITVDGVAIPISVTGSAAQTYSDLLLIIATALGSSAIIGIFSSTNLRIISTTTGVTSTVALTDTNLFSTLTGHGTPVSTPGAAATAPTPTTTVYNAIARIEQYSGSMDIIIESTTAGNTSAVTASYTSGGLFQSISASSTPVNTAITVTRDYREVGSPGTLSSSIQFTAAPTTGQVLELVLQ